ncbi:hypothetical protein [Dyadobacter sp. MSC1_007]|jgi:hypothetical protein|uniref:hypothetical protein n=1 Tax=Dyadobacter sp. MSC1_007 TaxID=2909264 RepID=UPI00202ED756|nr:hypothetical protein [Dyadobacter sp. MSC1_007]
MKNLIVTVLIGFLLWPTSNSFAQSEEEKLDLPGDNLNLYAVLKLFQESETLEGFERKLNEEDSEVNNLDLDGDNNIDYIRVEDHVDGNLHTITLKVAVSDREDQDVAAFYVEKKEDGQVLIQLIGDEDLYGKDYIIEPNSLSGETPNPGYSGGRESQAPAVNQEVTYVSAWPVVRYIYVPQYVIWHSPWRWHYYPSYWRPWRPRFWHYYYGYHYHWHYYYNGHFRRWPSYRNPVWHNRYYSSNFRSRSVIVRTRYSRGDYRNTYSRPSSARDGSKLFVKRNPKAPTTRERLPKFDKTGRPVIARPTNPRPGTTRPVTSPGTSRPSVGRPGTGNNDRPDNSRPAVTRPVSPRPSVTRPGTSRPSPATPSPARPAPSRPAPERPAPSRPAPARPETSRPATRPSSRESSTPRSSRQSEAPRQRAEPRGN